MKKKNPMPQMKNYLKFTSLEKQAKQTKSGLKNISLPIEAMEESVKISNKARLNYSVYFKDGSLLETSVEEVQISMGCLACKKEFWKIPTYISKCGAK